jgi:hypothetical protein
VALLELASDIPLELVSEMLLALSWETVLELTWDVLLELAIETLLEVICEMLLAESPSALLPPQATRLALAKIKAFFLIVIKCILVHCQCWRINSNLVFDYLIRGFYGCLI